VSKSNLLGLYCMYTNPNPNPEHEHEVKQSALTNELHYSGVCKMIY